jgi:hypothetical protein
MALARASCQDQPQISLLGLALSLVNDVYFERKAGSHITTTIGISAFQAHASYK